MGRMEFGISGVGTQVTILGNQPRQSEPLLGLTESMAFGA